MGGLKETARRGESDRAARQAKLSRPFYTKPVTLATVFAVSRRISRNFLRLLGGSRQDIAPKGVKAAVFTGVVPPTPTFPAHELPQAAGDLFAGIKKFAGSAVPIASCGLEASGIPRNG